MSSFVVSYDLMSPGQDYKKLHEYLKSHTTWAHPLDSTWIVVTDLSAVQLRDGIVKHIDSNDEVLVVESAKVGAWRGLSQDLTEWLKKYL